MQSPHKGFQALRAVLYLPLPSSLLTHFLPASMLPEFVYSACLRAFASALPCAWIICPGLLLLVGSLFLLLCRWASPEHLVHVATLGSPSLMLPEAESPCLLTYIYPASPPAWMSVPRGRGPRDPGHCCVLGSPRGLLGQPMAPECSPLTMTEPSMRGARLWTR